MTTAEKTGKPTILTESDQILSELQNEFVSLKSRMNSIEEEQEKNRNLVEQLSFHENLANEVITNHQEEIGHHKQNYHVIANVVNNLKTPVSQVVNNLSGVIAEIDDIEAQKTLQECMNTASNVLHSFDEVEDFCLNVGNDFSAKQSTVIIRDFFRDLVSDLQSTIDQDKTKYRLLVDKNVPEKTVLDCDTLKTCLNNLTIELQNAVSTSQTTIRIESGQKEQKYGIEIQDLCLSIDCDQTSEIQWMESWIDSIKANHAELLDSGFNLLQTRDLIRKAGGHLEILLQDNKIKGFKLFSPLTY